MIDSNQSTAENQKKNRKSNRILIAEPEPDIYFTVWIAES